MRWRVKVTAFVVSGMQIINLTLMNMNHIIKLLFLCLFFATACSQEEMNEVLKNHAEMEGQVNSIEELCKNMNRDIVALKLIINSSESGDYITGFKELADGSGRPCPNCTLCTGRFRPDTRAFSGYYYTVLTTNTQVVCVESTNPINAKSRRPSHSGSPSTERTPVFGAGSACCALLIGMPFCSPQLRGW